MMRFAYLCSVHALFLAAPSLLAQTPISYRNEVMAILSRAGCNQGICHGNLNGKGGFKLSLRGQDPELDRNAILRDMQGRRIQPQHPEQSLLLLKATGQIAHEGGPRFAVGSQEYQILRRWIVEGMLRDQARAPVLKQLAVTPGEQYLRHPQQELTIQVRATFSDGSSKDVAALAVFESTNPRIEVARDGLVKSTGPGETTIVVRYLDQQATARLAFVPARHDFVWSNPPAHNYIDEHVHARLQKLRINPSELSGDTEFLRRIYLDLLGLLPTPEETRKFQADSRPDKRARWIDTLLQRPEFADTWATRWADLLRVEEKQLDKKGVQVFHAWIRQSIMSNKPMNLFARELIASRGSTYQEPAANYYRALRDPQTRSEALAQVFLGIRMQCAKCHNHPYHQLSQNDYHQLAAFFARVQYKIVDNKRRDKLDQHEFNGEQIVYMDRTAEVKHPVSGAVLMPRYLNGNEIKAGADDDRLLLLADWVADAKNPYFARTQANRLWFYLLGRGIVDPDDDFRPSNPPVNAPLLDALTRDLTEHQYDPKHLIRTIMNSRTYQLSAIPSDSNREDETNFSRSVVRSLTAEALLDAISQVTGVPAVFEGYPAGTRAGQLPSLPGLQRKETSDPGTKFLRQFGKPERLLSCTCERSDSTTLAQALQMMTGPFLHQAVSAPGNRIGQLLKQGKSNAEILEELFLASLCRLPNERERSTLVARIESAPQQSAPQQSAPQQSALQRREALEDVLWGLLNSKEFLLRK